MSLSMNISLREVYTQGHPLETIGNSTLTAAELGKLAGDAIKLSLPCHFWGFVSLDQFAPSVLRQERIPGAKVEIAVLMMAGRAFWVDPLARLPEDRPRAFDGLLKAYAAEPIAFNPLPPDLATAVGSNPLVLDAIYQAAAKLLD